MGYRAIVARNLQPVVREFICVVVQQFGRWADFVEIRLLRNFISPSVSVDESVAIQFR